MRLQYYRRVGYNFIGHFLQLQCVKLLNFVLQYFAPFQDLVRVAPILHHHFPLLNPLHMSNNLLPDPIPQMYDPIDLIAVYAFKQICKRNHILLPLRHHPLQLPRDRRRRHHLSALPLPLPCTLHQPLQRVEQMPVDYQFGRRRAGLVVRAIDRGGGGGEEAGRAEGVRAGEGVGLGAAGVEPVLALHALEFLQIVDVHINDYYKLIQSS